MEKTKRIHLRASELDEKNLIAASEKLGTDKISSTICKSLETVATMEPELIAIDRPAIQALDDMSEYAVKHLQNFIDEFMNLTGCGLTIPELESVFQFVGKLSSTALTNEAISDLVKSKMFEKLSAQHQGIIITEANLPVLDLTNLFEIAGKMEHIPTLRTGSPVVIYWGTFTLADGRISVNNAELEKIKVFYRHYADTPEQIQKLNKVKKLCQALNEIMKDPDMGSDGIFSLVFYDKQAATWSPTGAWIKYDTMPRVLIRH